MPHRSVACHVRVMAWEHALPLVTVPSTTTVTLVPLQASKAVGASKLQAAPHSTVLLLAQVRTGGRVSLTVTVWLHMFVLLQQSAATQVRVITGGQVPLVTVLTTESVTLAPQ